ncbi:MAG: autotransporter outer membrane beta-barrel domain-containing protein, partial [Thermoguttaceae bacterium]
GVQFINQQQDGFNETGTSGFQLINDGATTNSLRTMLGGRFARDVNLRRGNMQLYLQGHWMHEYLDDVTEMSARFGGITSGDTFNVLGNSIGQDWAVMGTGLQLFTNSRINIFGSYDAMFNDKITLHAGTVGAKLVW